MILRATIVSCLFLLNGSQEFLNNHELLCFESIPHQKKDYKKNVRMCKNDFKIWTVLISKGFGVSQYIAIECEHIFAPLILTQIQFVVIERVIKLG